jgi:hypothetical protein
MLKLLLDEHISPAVASGIRRHSSRIQVYALAEWQSGALLGQSDAACMAEARRVGMSLVTYDRRTIPKLLKSWAEEGRHHCGVIFVDEKTISPVDIGGLTHALTELTRSARDWDWADRVVFLRRGQSQ